MTLVEELEMRINRGTDLIFIHGLLVMTKIPETEKELYRALHEVGKRLTGKQESRKPSKTLIARLKR